MTIDNEQCAVEICEYGYSGAITELTGAAEPFVTREDDNTDIFTPIRTQTGYLSVVDTTGSLMGSLIPSYNTERLVRLVKSGSVAWQGFLCAEAYTQPWTTAASVVQIPVKSMLAALRDVSVPANYVGYRGNVALMIIVALGELRLNVSTTEDVTTLCIESDVKNAAYSLLRPIIQADAFFDEQMVANDGDEIRTLVGEPVFNVFEGIARLYGLTFREKGKIIYISHYDSINGELYKQEIDWSYIAAISTGSSISFSENRVPSVGLTESVTFAGVNHNIGFVQGAKSAVVSLGLKSNRGIFDLPVATNDASQVLTVNASNGVVYGQLHGSRSEYNEQFFFEKYTSTVGDLDRDYNDEGASNYGQFRAKSVFLSPELHNNTDDDNTLITGACPCRWFYQENGEYVSLTNGLFLEMLTRDYDDEGVTPIHYAYSIASTSQYLAGGYLILDINAFTMFFSQSQLNPGWAFGAFCDRMVFRLSLVFGSFAWDGTDWVTISGTLPHFEVVFDTNTGKIVTNKPADTQVPKNEGYFIPIPKSGMRGIIRLYITNYSRMFYSTTDRTFNEDFRPKFINKLNIEFYGSDMITDSGRSRNVYRRTIIQSGFTDEKTIELTLGTCNNNSHSLSLLFNEDESDYLRGITYYTSGGTSYIRPEIHLLDRMSYHYSSIRRAIQCTVKDNVEIFDQRFVYQGRIYFATCSSHNWRDNTQTLKFIEV